MNRLYKRLAWQRKQAQKSIGQKDFLPELKKRISKTLPDAQIYLFGSFVRRDMGPESDIDILIVDQNFDLFTRAKFAAEFSKPYPFTRLQFHFVNIDELNDWYSHFIAKNELIKL